MPIIMRNLLILLTLINKVIQELETFLKRRQMFLTDLFTFLFLQQIKVCLQQLKDYNMYAKVTYE